MTLMQLIVFSRMKRQKVRLVFVLLAIAASSCLIVWTIGGYQALFSEAMNQQADYMGVYDLRIGSPSGTNRSGARRGGGGFAGPFSRRVTSSDDTRASRGNLKNTAEAKDHPMGTGRNRSVNRVHSPDAANHGKEFAPMPVRSKIDLALVPDRGLDLNKLPQGISEPTLAMFNKADQNKDGFLDDKEQESVPILRNRKKATQAGRPGPDGSRRDSMNGSEDRPGRGRTTGSGMNSVTIPADFIKSIRTDPSVILCDETATVSAFVYSKNMKNYSKSSQDSNGDDRERSNNLSGTDHTASGANHEADDMLDVPDGIDPELHRKGMAYYRSVMGLPAGMGTSFMGTTAAQPAYDLKEGKWINVKSDAMEAVLTEQGARRYGLRPGGHLLVITKTKEFQIEVIGIVEDKLSDGFYMSMAAVEKITGHRPQVNTLGLKLRVDAESFRAKWKDRLSQHVPGAIMQTGKDIAEQKKRQARDQSDMFRYQAICGTLLAVLAAVFIIFTTLNMSVDDQRRQIAFYRAVGLSRGQIGCSIMLESLVLAIPGWLIGIVAGWVLLWLGTGRVLIFDIRMTVFSFVCAVLGAIVAALYPMFLGMTVRPLEAIRREPTGFMFKTVKKTQAVTLVFCFLVGVCFLGADLFLVYVLPMETEKKALLHSGLGIAFLASGMLCLIPVLIGLVETVALPILAFLFRFDHNLLRGELSGNVRRTTAVAVVLSIGGGLFVSMQIWGYSMLGPFLPGREMPECFAAFLPVGLKSDSVQELRTLPGIKFDEFLPVAVEQAALAENSITTRKGMGGQFANLVFFGVDIHDAFDGFRPLVELHFVQGNRNDALAAMKNNRGVVITDSVSVDYHLNVGDTLKVQHPRNPELILQYPIVGVISFPGWQWLSKTGGVRRHFGRSGGIAFANQKDILEDYQLDRYSYFWFNTDGKFSSADMETTLDKLAQKNLRSQRRQVSDDKTRPDTNTGQTAYVKLSTRESLLNSITQRADSVIWGLSKMPLITLIITSVAVVGVVVNSVRSRRRLFGVLRAVGMTRFAIVRLILVESILIGLVASISSFLFGLLAAQGALKLGQSMFGTVDPPMVLPWGGLSFGLVLTVLLCLAAAIYPAFATGRQAPLDLLREGLDSN